MCLFFCTSEDVGLKPDITERKERKRRDGQDNKNSIECIPGIVRFNSRY